MKARTLCTIALAAGLISCTDSDTRPHDKLYKDANGTWVSTEHGNYMLSKAALLQAFEIAERNQKILEMYNRQDPSAQALNNARKSYQIYVSGTILSEEDRTNKFLNTLYKVNDIVKIQQDALAR